MKELSLPKEWVVVEIANALATQADGKLIHQGWSPQCDREPAKENEWGVLKTTAIQDGYFLEYENKRLPQNKEPKKRIEVQNGDILVTNAGPRNRCGVICYVKKTRSKLLLSGKMYRLRFPEGLIYSSYVESWLRTSITQKELNSRKTGISESGLNMTQGRFLTLPVVLAPFAEQKVIADKLDTLLAQVETTKARLQRIPEILKTFRQSVLNAAVSGKLTEEWRSSNNIYSAEQQYGVLLKSEEEYLSQKKKDDRSKIYKEKVKFRTQKVDTSTMQLPQGWIQKPFFELCLLNRGFDLPKAKRVAGDYLILSAGGEIGTHNEYKVDGPCITVGRSGSVGQVFFTKSKAWPLNTALYAKDMGFSYPRFVYYKLLTMNLAQFASSTSVPTLNRNEFTHEMVAIPPFEEQTEIVRRVEELFAFADSIEEKANAALARVNNLTQSILAKAFRGELTEQWRKDNPELITGENSAEALLAKIKAEREALTPAKKNRTGKKSKK